LLSFIFNEGKEFRVFELADKKFFAEKISSTFHGRDIFAPVAAHLAKGVKAREFGKEITDFARFDENKPREIGENEIEAEIIEIDHFGNLITNLKKEDLPEKFALEIGAAKIDKLRKFFAETRAGEIFMIFGSAGFLEIAVFKDSAKNILQVETGRKILVKVL
jgi:S-adenosyl-L-methionine hydrolase (adenosine-forming)